MSIGNESEFAKSISTDQELGNSEHIGRHAAKNNQCFAKRNDCDSSWAQSDGEFTRPSDTQLADTSITGSQRDELRRAYKEEWNRKKTHGSVSEFCGLFAPGPNDERWEQIIERRPELAPAVKPDFRMLVNGLAFDMDDSRTARIKCVGNGVVALCAATAFVVLTQRSGIFELIKQKDF